MVVLTTQAARPAKKEASPSAYLLINSTVGSLNEYSFVSVRLGHLDVQGRCEYLPYRTSHQYSSAGVKTGIVIERSKRCRSQNVADDINGRRTTGIKNTPKIAPAITLPMQIVSNG